MTDPIAVIRDLRRPRLLIRAARAGLADYNRARDLKRLMQLPVPPAPERALSHLIAAEAEVEQTRREGEAGYSFIRHIELLIAMIAESQLLPRPARP